MKKIAILTSGGDAPGMNAAIRAVVRTAIFHQAEVIGIRRGYDGFIEGDFLPMDANSVSDIIQRGGTVLKTSRSERFKTRDGMLEAKHNANDAGIEGLILIGGDGTFKGAYEFAELSGIHTMGIPGTIDNDLFGTDYTIGYDTALNTVIEAVDKIRDTATSHHRLFFIEVMGRDAGFIALNSGIASGAEDILIPEIPTSIDAIVNRIEAGKNRNKSSFIIIVAEGDIPGGAYEIARQVKEKYSYFETRVTVIGHMQRGGSPTAFDRILASKLGVAATEGLISGRKNEMAGFIKNQIAFTPFSKTRKHLVDINEGLLQMAHMLGS